MAYQCTKFEVYLKLLQRGLKNSNGSHDVTTPLSGTIYYPLAGISYDQPANQIWSFLCSPTTKI